MGHARYGKRGIKAGEGGKKGKEYSESGITVMKKVSMCTDRAA